MTRALNLLSNLFPLWVAAACAYALVDPSWIAWYQRPHIIWGLSIIMLGMGITLSVKDFKRVATMPKAIAAGVAAQFLLMPFLGWTIGKALQLPTDFAVGLILVACCPGGTASNVVVYIARANIALSVLMTMCSTSVAIALTPLLTSYLAGQYVPVDAAGLFLSMIQIVLAPVAIGVLLHHIFPKLVKAVLPVGPLVSVIVIALICAAILGPRRDAVLESGLQMLIAVVLLHSAAFTSGYLFARILGYDTIIRRTISIEVGMQNSGLATALATKHFAATPLTAVPGAISAVMHSVIGSIIAAYWRLKSNKPTS
ncbi:Sodium Bile acid symporter family [Verrucomicrobiia bacterium DG1235]|nr:Sodium Bile acid symporter family [Verrucomicrobiae bacterium DG1235]